MGLYQYKDFLTLDDVGYFLLSKGLLPPVPIEQLYLSDLRPFIVSMIQSDKITPVFDYDGYVIIIDRNIYEYEVDTYKGMVQASHTMIQNWKKGKTIFYKPFKGKFDPFQDTFVNERYRKYIDDGKQIILYAQNYDDDTTEVYLQYPREQLEAIFNQPTNTEQAKDEQITTLQQQLQEAQARIKELESTQNEVLHPRTTNNVHTNTALIALNDMIATHWQDPNNPPKQQFIQSWIIDNYPSIDPSKALWIDKIIRHKDR